MRELSGKILGQLHLLILCYALWGVYDAYEIHTQTLAASEAQIPTLEAEIAGFKKRLKDIDTYKKNVENSKKSVEEVFKNIEKVQRQLPVDVNDIDILDYIAKEGKTLNIPEMSVTPVRDDPRGFYILKPYDIKARGTFLQLVIFMERLASAERLYNVQKFRLIADQVPQKGRFQVINLVASIETYKYNQNYKESSGIEEINAQFAPGSGAATEERPRKRKRRPKKDNGDGE